MAPIKFVAPLRKNGAASSFSFSSNSSQGSMLNQDSNKLLTPSAPINKPLTLKPTPVKENSKSKASGFSVPKEKPLEVSSPTNNSTAVEKRKLESTSKDDSAEPPAKQHIMEIPPTISSSSTIKVEVVEDNNLNDKENLNPESSSKKTKADKEKPKRPFKSLTNQEYEMIFNAVISNYPTTEPVEPTKSPEKKIQEENGVEASEVSDAFPGTSEPVDESTDILTFSQSELDSEDETVVEINNTVVENKTLVSSKDVNEKNDPFSNSINTTTADNSLTSNPAEQSTSQDQMMTPSPSIIYMCHESQPVAPEDLCDENTTGDSQTAQQSSKEPVTIKTEILSIGSSSQITSTPFATSQKMDFKLSLSQEQNISPINTSNDFNTLSQFSQLLLTPVSTSNKNASVSELPLEPKTLVNSTSRPGSVRNEGPKTPTSVRTPASSTMCTPQSNQDPKTLVRTPTILHTPQSSQDPKIPVRTPVTVRTPQSSQDPKKSVRTPVTVHTPQSSQDPKTPVRTPVAVRTPQSSQDPKTPVKTPVTIRTPQSSKGPKTPNSNEENSSVSCTPNGSQQFIQEIQFTPPPSNLTARDRLKWIQKKRLAGNWVRCDKEVCGKWRYLPDCHDPTTLPDEWFCNMHPDEEQNNCNAPEKRESLRVEEDMIFSEYSPGSLVWARLSGYPWWPAMVEDDPDLECFFWLNEFSDIPTWYHVVFFDDDKRSSCARAWIRDGALKKLDDLDVEDIENSAYNYRVAAAYKKACSAKNLPVEDRLAQHSFAACYKGPIGGPSKTLYEGPIGYRQAAT
ncbi:hypothetical protein FOCC_FOCC017010 [Frankliniella occidentalis]|nr:hypothetical protein FOCC_FOCC017010 [Frankliniella occidentalis]